jgi:hypothetical protein
MKNKTTIPFCLFSIMILFYSTAFSQERPKDFRGLTWGTHISKIEGLTFKETGEQGVQFYYRASDNLKVGNGQVDAVRYKFRNNQLIGIILDFKTYNQYLDLRSLFVDIYGLPDQGEDNMDPEYGGEIKAFWYAKKDTEANIILSWMQVLMINKGFAAVDWKGAVTKGSGQ